MPRMSLLSGTQRAALRSLCDTVVPALERADDASGFWRRKATDLHVHAVLQHLLAPLPEAQQKATAELLDALHSMGLHAADSQAAREQLLADACQLGPEVAAGVATLVSQVLFVYYGLPVGNTGSNPNWQTFGFPGAAAVTRPTDSSFVRPFLVPEPGAVLEADAVVVGSGAGGAVVAAELAQRGRKVIVLEAGGHFSEADYPMLELWAYQNLYYRGGPVPTADRNVTLQAGSTFGGGTTVNWSNCLRPKPWVREQWSREFGLSGVDGPPFDAHLDAVMSRLNANDRCSDWNGPTLRLREGAAQLGWSFQTVLRNADEATYTPETAGYIGFGDASGSKQTAVKTYLRDAAQRGAEMMVHSSAQRILVERGRATGVAAIYSDAARGVRCEFSVRAPVVVVAAGALESPALLLRSQIGGAAVGHYLRLHPCTAVTGLYSQDQRAWWGAPHTGLVDQFARGDGDGYGFLLETTHYTPGLGAAGLPFTTAAEHKQKMFDFARGSTFIALLRDHGHGSVTIDSHGQAVHRYDLTDEIDRRGARQGIAAAVRLHAAAGAQEIGALAAGLPTWSSGTDLERYIEKVQAMHFGFIGVSLFSAHQMGSCRMGTDRKTSVANPLGELHDVQGVWIGDASAFPTATGTNPMVTIMALARRTAQTIAAV
jgi:choline dehydrogenase-like flavoprotein